MNRRALPWLLTRVARSLWSRGRSFRRKTSEEALTRSLTRTVTHSLAPLYSFLCSLQGYLADKKLCSLHGYLAHKKPLYSFRRKQLSTEDAIAIFHLRPKLWRGC